MVNNYSKLRVGVVGATGYSGVELLRRLARHPGAKLVAAMSSGRAAAAIPVDDLAPGSGGGLSCVPASIETMLAAKPDFVFLCTPHETSMEWAAALLKEVKTRVIDLSGAFRFRDAVTFESWYSLPHTARELLPEAVYGWPERHREAIRSARLVANPGCYATAAATALWPLVEAAALAPGAPIICDAKSGASGAGKGLRDDLHFVELEGNCKAYGVYTHRHTPEIAEQTGMPAGVDFTFTPHLLPTSRGILATSYVRLREGASVERLTEMYRASYAGHPFVRVRGGRLPELRESVHTNFCDVGFSVHKNGGQAVIVSCLDNLVKGAAGQALQNFNLMAGWPEETGLL